MLGMSNGSKYQFYFILLVFNILRISCNNHTIISNYTTLKNLVIITSVLNPVDKPLSYTSIRSGCTHESRLNQTIQSIQSAKQKIPDTYIVIIEGSSAQINKYEQNQLLNAGCDMIYFVSHRYYKYIDGPNKSLAELYMITDYLDRYIDHSLVIDREFLSISKLSGRYYLTDSFNWNKYDIKKPLFQCVLHCIKKHSSLFDSVFDQIGLRSSIDNQCCNTRFYRIPSRLWKEYYIRLIKGKLNDQLRDTTIDIERFNIAKDFADKTIVWSHQSLLGVKGSIGCSNVTIED